MPSFRRSLLAVVVAGLCAAPAVAQITWNVTYLDGNIQAGGIGFADPTVAAGETLSNGQLRRNSITAATNYLGTILDGRGTVNVQFAASLTSGSGALASYGPDQLVGALGTFQNGGMYQGARTNTHIFGTDPDGSGQFNFGYGWNYAGQNSAPSGSRFDMVTVGIHEIGHGLGFLSFASPTGQGLTGQAVGSPDVYSGMDRFLQRGNGPLSSSGLFNTTITNSGYGSFTGLASTFTNGNNTTTGLFFGGAFAREVFGAAVPMYAPNPYQSGSSVSHVNDSTAVMNPSVAPNVVKRFKAYEIAMLMDAGWNVYNWNETTGGTANWSTGSTNVAQSRWRSDSGIVSVSGTNYNRFSAQNPAPVLPVYGQVTANIVLNFRNNSTTTAYTSTNDFASPVRLSRLTFASANAAGGITIAGGTLNFGLNSNGTASVLVPKILQNGLGAVTVSSAVQTNNIATQTVDGVLFTGHSGVVVEGTGSGLVTLSGAVGGTGGLTKNSSTFNLVLSGTNTYTGATTVNAGTVFVNGNSGGATGAVAVNGTGVLTGSGTLGGAVTVNSGGFVEAGNAAVGTLTVNNSLTVNNGGNLRAQVGASTADVVNMSAAANVLDLKNGAVVALVGSGFDRSTATYTLADLNGTGNVLKLNGTDLAVDQDITVFTSTGGNAGTNSFTNGQVSLSLSGFTLVSGEKFLLRRSTGGDFVLLFTPVPEPGAILLVCGLVTAGGVAWRRWKSRAKTLAA